MQRANEHGVYAAEQTEELARVGRAHAAIEFCQCDKDGLYRYALDMAYSYGGFCGPISDQRDGFKTCHAAKDAAAQEMLRRFPQASMCDPQNVHDELRTLKAKIEAAIRQPSLF